jgi:hypothetical protein
MTRSEPTVAYAVTMGKTRTGLPIHTSAHGPETHAC